MSDKNELNKKDWRMFFQQAFLWLIPLGLSVGAIYFGNLVILLQSEGHVFNVSDFIPTTFQINLIIGAVVKYVTDRFFDLYRRYTAGK